MLQFRVDRLPGGEKIICLGGQCITFSTDYNHALNYEDVVEEMNKGLQDRWIFQTVVDSRHTTLKFGPVYLRVLNKSLSSNLQKDAAAYNDYLMRYVYCTKCVPPVTLAPMPVDGNLVVEFTANLWQLARNSGKYDNRPHQSADEIARMIYTNIPLSASDRIQLETGGNARIRCTPQQFVKFQVARCNAGHINRFRDLRVKLLPPGPPPILESTDLFNRADSRPDELDVNLHDYDVKLEGSRLRLTRKKR